MKKTFLIISVLIVTLFSVFTNPLVNADDGWVIDGDTVYIDDSQVYLSATPHTLTASGWVEFELLSKNYSGDIDIVLGVDTEDNISFKKPERWKEDVPHKVFEWVPAELQGEITLCDITDYEYWQIEDYTGEIDIGNYNNLYVANVTYQDCFFPDSLIYNHTIAFYDYEWLNSEHTSAVLYYNYDGQIREYHTEYYDDWDTLNVDFTSSNYQWRDITIWYHAALDVSIAADTLYKARVWADIPFSGLDSTSGKYYWAVKPSGETIQQAISNNHLYFLDPWYDSIWNYRKSQCPTNAIPNYIMELTVHYGAGVDSGADVYLNSKCNTDFSDLRFTESDGITELPYWIEDKIDSNYAIVRILLPQAGHYSNAGSSLTIPTYDGSGEAQHPSVKYFSGGWNGYVYWMAMAPLPNLSSTYENPSILVSSDGLSWSVPSGGSNPIDTPQTNYNNSDPYLFYDSVADELWCYYREYRSAVDVDNIQLRKSSDGINWGAESTVVTSNYGKLLSPSVQKVSGTYYMWTYNLITKRMERRSSADGSAWGAASTCTVFPIEKGYYPFHGEVYYNATQSRYYNLMSFRSISDPNGTRGHYIRWMTSEDGLQWTVDFNSGLEPSGSGWDADTIYKSTFVFNETTNTVKMWYSAWDYNTPSVVGIGYAGESTLPNKTPSIYIYYGNSGASTTSALANVALFSDDFESGTLNNWDTAGAGVSVQGTTVKHGSYAAKSLGSAVGADRLLAKEDLQYEGRFMIETHFRVAVKSAAQDGYINMVNQVPKTIYNTIFYNGHLTYYNGVFNNYTNDLTYNAATWYKVEILIDYYNGKFRVWLNGSDSALMNMVDFENTAQSVANYTEDLVLAAGIVAGRDVYIDDYLVRPYVDTEPSFGSWGSEQQLAIPTVTTGNASNIDCDSFNIWGNITDDGYGTITTVGFYYGSGNLTSNVTDSYSTDNFTLNISGLSENTTYLVQAFAINEKGIGTGTTINVTTTICQFCASPTDLRLSELSDNRIYAEWSLVDNVTDYLILVSNVEYPDDPEDQYGYAVAYSGNDTSAILEGYETDINEYFFSLWTHCNPYSEEYVTASIGGESLDELAISFHDIGLLFISMVLLIFFSVIAFWKENSIMFGLSAGISIAVGFYCYDVDSNPFMLGISILLWVYSVICLIFGLMCMFKRRPAD